MSKESKKPIRLDLQLCYSGFKLDELEYIDYTRTITESEEECPNAPPGKLDSDYDGRLESIEEETDGILSECDYEEYTSFSREEYQSYLCSTPTHGRKHRGYFTQEAEMSGFNEYEYAKNYVSANSIDSGIHTKASSKHSLVSFYDDAQSEPGSIDLDSSFSGTSCARRKIEVTSDMHNPYSEVDDLELSIEEEMSQSSHTSTVGSLKRRLSLKLLRRNISTGVFGSYLQRNPEIPSSEQASSQQVPNTSSNKPTGPINLWFKKFRNRHFI